MHSSSFGGNVVKEVLTGPDFKEFDRLLYSINDPNERKKFWHCRDAVKVIALGILSGRFEVALDLNLAAQCLKYSIKYFPSQTETYWKIVKASLDEFHPSMKSAAHYSQVAKIVKKYDQKQAFLLARESIKMLIAKFDELESMTPLYQAISVISEMDVQAAYEISMLLDDGNPMKIGALCKVAKKSLSKPDLGKECFEKIKCLVERAPYRAWPNYGKVFSIIKYINLDDPFMEIAKLREMQPDQCDRGKISALCELYKIYVNENKFEHQKEAVDLLENVRIIYWDNVDEMNQFCFCFDEACQSKNCQLLYSCYPLKTHFEMGSPDEQFALQAQNAILIGQKIRSIQPILAENYFNQAYEDINEIDDGIDYVRLMCLLFKKAVDVCPVQVGNACHALIQEVIDAQDDHLKIQQLSMLILTQIKILKKRDVGA